MCLLFLFWKIKNIFLLCNGVGGFVDLFGIDFFMMMITNFFTSRAEGNPILNSRNERNNSRLFRTTSIQKSIRLCQGCLPKHHQGCDDDTPSTVAPECWIPIRLDSILVHGEEGRGRRRSMDDLQQWSSKDNLREAAIHVQCESQHCPSPKLRCASKTWQQPWSQ